MIDNINDYLQAQPKNHRIVFYVAIVIAIIFFGYILALSDMMEEVEDGKMQIQEKEQKLKKAKSPTRFTKLKIMDKKIKKTNEAIKQKEENIEKQGEYLKIISLKQIDDSTFAVFLKRILSQTKQMNVKLINAKVNSKQMPYFGKLVVKKELMLKGNGRFLNVLKLLRFAEEQKFLIKLQSLKVQKPKITKEEKEKIDPKHVVFEATFEMIGVSL